MAVLRCIRLTPRAVQTEIDSRRSISSTRIGTHVPRGLCPFSLEERHMNDNEDYHRSSPKHRSPSQKLPDSGERGIRGWLVFAQDIWWQQPGILARRRVCRGNSAPKTLLCDRIPGNGVGSACGKNTRAAKMAPECSMTRHASSFAVSVSWASLSGTGYRRSRHIAPYRGPDNNTARTEHPFCADAVTGSRHSRKVDRQSSASTAVRCSRTGRPVRSASLTRTIASSR